MNAKFFVPFETVKLLKKKGYPQAENDWYYEPAGEMLINEGVAELLRHRAGDNADGIVAAPTYHEVEDWLEGKDIYIDVCRTDNTLLESGYRWHCYIWERDTDDWCTVTIEYPTREEAINEAILKALEML